MERVLWMALFSPAPTGRRGLPLVLVGEPGKVKTSICRQVSGMAALRFESLVASLREPADFLGLPYVKRIPVSVGNAFLSPDGEEEASVTSHSAPEFAFRSAQAMRAVLLLDEVNTCPPAVQAALLRLLFEGVCGDLELPHDVRFLLAMNDAEDAAGGWELAPPLANRMGHLRWEGPSIGQFGEYLMAGGGARVHGKLRNPTVALVDPRVEEAAVDDAWPEAWATAVGQVLGFLQSKSSAVHVKPKAGTKEASGPWPSMRTWDFATAATAVSNIYGASSIEEQILAAAFIGDPAYQELYTWRKNNDLPNPGDFLDGKAKFTHNPLRLDRTVAVLSSATSLLVDPSCHERAARAQRMWGALKELPDDAVDVAASSVVQMCQARLMVGNNEAYRTIARFEPFLTAAGVLEQGK